MNLIVTFWSTNIYWNFFRKYLMKLFMKYAFTVQYLFTYSSVTNYFHSNTSVNNCLYFNKYFMKFQLIQMTLLTANIQRNSVWLTPYMTHSFWSHSSSMSHVTPPVFEPRPPAPLASILTTRPWLSCKNRFPKKVILDIPMVRVSRSIF